MSFKSFLDKPVKIYKRTVGTGFNKEYTWSLRKKVLGMKKLLTGNEQYLKDGKVVIADSKVFLEVTTMEETDRIYMDSNYYDVLAIDNINGMGHHLEVKMKLLTPGTASAMGL